MVFTVTPSAIHIRRWVLLVLLGLVVPAQMSVADVRAIRLGENGERTRVVFDLDQGVQPNVFLLPNPSRVVVDFSTAQAGDIAEVSPKGLVTKLRFGLFNPKTFRIVLDLARPAIVARQFALPASGGAAHRYVLDLAAASGQDFAAAVKANTARGTAQTRPQTPSRRIASRQPGARRMIVIDPGHGGVDPGTLGVLGVSEKIIVLKVSKAIADALEDSGRYRVRLTRSTDIYIPHRQRYGVAHEVGADLFISVHADSISNPKVRGGTIYTLSEKASDREAARLATKENKSDIIAGLDLAATDNVVSGILIDLAQRETLNSSVAFARALLPHMRRHVKMHKRGHRFANLLVLKSIDVPSILLETGYLTNRQDARLLNSRSGQNKIAQAVLAAVDEFFTQQTTAAR